ncbi:MAG: AAA family ATPase [Candidatus Syntropharchaeia archaeon]
MEETDEQTIVRNLREELYKERMSRERLQQNYERLKMDYNELLGFINESKKPPTYASVVIEKRKDDAIVYGFHGLQTVSYGRVDKNDIKPGCYVLVGNVPVGTPSMHSYGARYQQTSVPGIVEVLEKEAPLIRGKIFSIEKGEDFGLKDEDVVCIGTAPFQTRSIRIKKERIKELDLKPNVTVDCLPETFDIVRAGKYEEVKKYEVIERPEVSFDDIGGLVEAKKQLITGIIAPLINPEDYERYGRTSKKILFYGPPGCGKTMLAQALSHTLRNCGFYRVNAAEIHEMWVGKSEENLRNIFKTAIEELKEKKFDYMILFFDEIDALAPHRGVHPGSSGVEERVVGELLSWLEGFKPLPPNLIVIGATNMPILVDAAVRQRFDKIIEVPQPKDRDTVREIISKYITYEKVPIDHFLIQDYGSRAPEVLIDELTDFLFEEEKIPTRYGTEISKKNIITGRLISQIVELAKNEVLYDRTILKREIPSEFKSLLKSINVEERAAFLRKRYESPDQIGLNMEYLKNAFEKGKYERAEEIMSSQMMYRIERPKLEGYQYLLDYA